MHWRDYEKSVFDILRQRFPQADALEADVMLLGELSKIYRQIDVKGTASLLGVDLLAIVDCKCYSKRVDVKDVESVIGMAADVRASVALIVTTVGFTRAAKMRAENERNIQTHLDIVTLKEAAAPHRLPTMAFMYRGRMAAIVLAPSGWLATSNIVNNAPVLPVPALCYLHPNNLNVDTAFRRKEIAWCHIQDNPGQEEGYLESLLETHREGAVSFDPEATFELWEEALQLGGRHHIFRKIDYKTSGYVDFTIFIEVEGAVFYSCIVADYEFAESALRKLRFVAQNARIIYAPTVDSNDSHDAWNQLFPPGGVT